MSNAILDSISNYISIRSNKSKEHNKYYPSQASCYISYNRYKKLYGKCLRASYYSCIGVKEESQYTLAAFLGDDVEKSITKIYKANNILVDIDIKFEIEKYKISGKLDAIILENDKEVGVEIKSIGSNKFNNDTIFGIGNKKGFPKWNHLFQTLIYCYALRERLSYFYIHYIRRDTAENKIFKISIAPNKDGKIYPVIDGTIDYRFTINDLLDRYELLDFYVSNNKIPKKEFIETYSLDDINSMSELGLFSEKQMELYKRSPFGSIECKYCSFKNQCKEDN